MEAEIAHRSGGYCHSSGLDTLAMMLMEDASTLLMLVKDRREKQTNKNESLKCNSNCTNRSNTRNGSKRKLDR